MGEATFVQGVTGTQLRRRPVRVGGLTPAQRSSAERMETIAAHWSQVDLPGIEAWRAYAASLEAMRPALQRQPMTSYQAFLGLTTRLLMIDPAAPVPLLPPTGAFAGDAVRVTVSATPPAPSSSPGERSQTAMDRPRSDEEGVLFSANRPNAPGVVTETLVQRLASVGRAPVADRYVSRGFVAFEEGALEAVVPCLPGWAACAVRFVDAGTGEATATFPLGIVGVGSV